MFVKFTRLDAILLHANSGPLKQTISFAIRAELVIFVHPVYTELVKGVMRTSTLYVQNICFKSLSKLAKSYVCTNVVGPFS